MFHALPYKTKQFFFVLIKLSIVVGAFYFIYQKLAENEDLELSVFFNFLSKNNTFSPKNIIFLIILSSFNWFFEIYKWKTLVSTLKPISFSESFKQCLASLTSSLITPNRIGEYGAKAIYFSKDYRKRILLLNLIGNINQMLATSILGCIGIAFLVNTYDIPIDYFKIAKIVFVFTAVIILSVFGFTRKRINIRGFSIDRIKTFWDSISSTTKIITLCFSVMRYLIFSFQFYYLLLIFGIEVSYLKAMMVISSMYLLASVIPTLFIFDVVIKSSVAVYLFSLVGVNEITILSIVVLMWILNTVIPSVLGSYHVINFNVNSEASS